MIFLEQSITTCCRKATLTSPLYDGFPPFSPREDGTGRTNIPEIFELRRNKKRKPAKKSGNKNINTPRTFLHVIEDKTKGVCIKNC